MRMRERKRVVKKFNEILEAIDDMLIEDVYSTFDRPDDLDEQFDDEEEILDTITNFDSELEFLEVDIENYIEDLRDDLEKIKKLQGKLNEVYDMIDKYSSGY